MRQAPRTCCEMEKLWTTTEVARYLGIQEIDVEGLVRQGKLTGYKLGGQFLRFRPDQVEALKGQMIFRPSAPRPAIVPHRQGWLNQLSDLVYFYDFYLVAALLLAVFVVYLMVAG